ncbi:AAA family ATPase [Nocardia sp. NPDC051750]|uniref:nucleotide-binding protein n=1 Tax=Nocardia sp. NPDC051750 TaxID=3364325 RepID=UPI0037A05627
MSRSNDGLPMLPPWLADTEVTGVGQTNFRNYEPPPVENLPQDEVIPETPEPSNGFFNRRGRDDERAEPDGEKKKGKGWFRNKNKDEPSLEDRVGELLPNSNGPRPAQRNNWAEATSQWSTQPAPQTPDGPRPGDQPRQPDPVANPDLFPQSGQGGPPEQFPQPGPPNVPGPPHQAPVTHAPDGRAPWGPAQQGPQWGPPPDVQQAPGPDPRSAPPHGQQPGLPTQQAAAQAPPQYPGPGMPAASAEGPGFGEPARSIQGMPQAPDRPSLPTRNPSEPAPEFDRLRPHHPIPPHPGPQDDAAIGSSRAADSAAGERSFLPPPPPLPDPSTGPAADSGPVAQQPLRRLPDLPPAPGEEPTDARTESPAEQADTRDPAQPGPGAQRDESDDRSISHGSGAHPLADRPESRGPAADGAAPDAGPQTSGPGALDSAANPFEQGRATPDTAAGAGPLTSTPGHPMTPADTGAPQWRAPDNAPMDPAQGGPGPQWRAPESAPMNPAESAPGPQWQAPEQPATWQSGPAAPPPGPPAQHGGPPTGHPAPGPHQQPNQPPAQQWQNPAPPAPPQHGGPGPAGWQQQGGQPPHPQQYGTLGPGGPSLEDVSVRRAKKAAGSGWRKVVHHASGGKINPGMSAEERRMLELVARIRQPVRGDYRIAVLSLKGGVGKTTTTIGLGSTFASIRGDRVIAVDANPDFGTLSQRVPLQTRSTVRDLLLDPAIQRYSDVRRHTSQATSRLEVLASERDPAASEAFNEGEYRAVARILQRFYNIILTDCGTGLMHSAMAGVLQLAHSLVLISPTAIDGAQSASATLDWLSLHGYHHLVQNAVVVINSPRDGTPNIDVQQLRQYFLSRCRAVHMVPFDPHMSEGAEIDLPRLKKETKRAYVELAATVADDFGRSYQPHHGG